jgi:LCP family protein required for cell wall assembly
VNLRNVRLLQLLGIVVALVGLAGYWFNRDAQRVMLDQSTIELIGISSPEEFQASFVVAGRDYDHVQEASPCRWVGGRCVRDRVGRFVYGNRTDTILYVHIIGTKVNVVAIPRDLYLDHWATKINAMYAYQGAEGLKRSVSEILGVPIEYHAIVNIDIFKGIVDALGGVDVNVPYRMAYTDAAAGLVIDLHPGPQRLNGEQAAGFVRFRQTTRGDIDRIDRVKTLAYAVLKRLRELNVRAATVIPALTDTFFQDVETNAPPTIIAQLLPRLPRLELQATTLPTHASESGNSESYRPREVEAFVAEMLGGRAREFTEVPATPVLITNSSGVPGLEEEIKARLISMGIPEEYLLTREASVDPAPTRLVATRDHWADAAYYASLFHIGQQQIDRLSTFNNTQIGVELILGEDASTYPSARALAQGGN